ncbi:MAG: hypothetical protein C0500_02630 [Sphingobium sp.]|nr:hypothetical protein [Sphingobium sp.]
MPTDIEAQLADARTLRTEGQADRAAAAYREAADLARLGEQPQLRAHALRHLSDLAREAGDIETALASGREALSLYRADPAALPLDVANALRVTALALGLRGQTNEAVPLWREARGLYAGLGIEAGVAECDQHLPRRGN